MSDDLPIYPDMKLRTGLQFAELEKFRSLDSTPVWEKSDSLIGQMEGASNLAEVRQYPGPPSKPMLLQIHQAIFQDRPQAGQLRQKPMLALYRGQDCPDPEFIDRSLDNFFNWLGAESLAEIHPIEKAVIVLTRIVDIWPFEFGNLTIAIVFANLFLRDAGFSPFFVLPEHTKEFDTIVRQAMTIDTQPLVNAIHRTIKREMEAIATR